MPLAVMATVGDVAGTIVVILAVMLFLAWRPFSKVGRDRRDNVNAASISGRHRCSHCGSKAKLGYTVCRKCGRSVF